MKAVNSMGDSEIIVVDDPNELVTSDLCSSFSVAASAGCGKTHILISRTLALLESGIPLERLLLLTFTDNAAREMRTRLSSELLKVDDKWAKDALEGLPYSSIQTINSFAFEIISGNYTQAGLSAQPSILDEIEHRNISQFLFSEHYDRWANNKDHSLFFALSSSIDISRTKLFDLSKAMIKSIPIDTNGLDFDISITQKKLRNQIGKFEKECRSACNKILCSLESQDISEMKANAGKRIKAIKAICESSVATEVTQDFFREFYRACANLSPGRLSADSRSDMELLEESFDTLRFQIEEGIPELIDTILGYSSELLFGYVLDSRKSRFEMGKISHDECLTLASLILEQDSARFDIWKRYSSVLIDEFQDTDDVQIRLVKALAEDDSGGEVGRLFVVGDEKQSIYGFRGAQVDSYIDFVKSSGLKQVALEKSYRSSNLVLEPINKIMSELMPAYRNMKALRNESLPPGSLNEHVVVLGAQEVENVETLRDKRADDIAQSIPNFLNREIVDRQGPRESTYSDIAILVRNSTGINNLVSTLQDSSIPVQVDSVDLIWDLSFTKMTISLLSAIANPTDSISILGALKSPIFGCSNNDLISHADRGKAANIKTSLIWNYNYPFEEIDDSKVKQSLNLLEQWHKDNGALLPTQTLTTLHSKYGLVENFERLGKANSESISQYLLLLATHFEEGNTQRTLMDFVEFVRSVKD